MTGLHEMIQRELARREEASANYNPFSVIVTPKAMTDVTAAVAAIEEQYKTGGDRVRIAPGIADDVYAALEKGHPHMFKKLGKCSVIARVIVDSHRSTAPVPVAIEDVMSSPGGAAGTPVRPDDDNAVMRAARRIAAMRGLL
jgi:hypothetical protein